MYDVARFSIVALPKFMHTVKTSFATIERNEGMAIEAAAVLASPEPLSVVTMGTFPLSLIPSAGSGGRNRTSPGRDEPIEDRPGVPLI